MSDSDFISIILGSDNSRFNEINNRINKLFCDNNIIDEDDKYGFLGDIFDSIHPLVMARILQKYGVRMIKSRKTFVRLEPRIDNTDDLDRYIEYPDLYFVLVVMFVFFNESFFDNYNRGEFVSKMREIFASEQVNRKLELPENAESAKSDIPLNPNNPESFGSIEI